MIVAELIRDYEQNGVTFNTSEVDVVKYLGYVSELEIYLAREDYYIELYVDIVSEELFDIVRDPYETFGIYNYTWAKLVSSRSSQTITFNNLPTKMIGDPPFALTATASSGLTVSYTSSNTNVASISGNTVTIVGAGSTTISANQAGNNVYGPATQVQQTLTILKIDQTITFDTLVTKISGDPPFALTATASSGLTVSYTSSNTNVASISGNTVTIVGVGSTTISANQTGNNVYNPATQVQQFLLVQPVPEQVQQLNSLNIAEKGSTTLLRVVNSISQPFIFISAYIDLTGLGSSGIVYFNRENSSNPVTDEYDGFYILDDQIIIGDVTVYTSPDLVYSGDFSTLEFHIGGAYRPSVALDPSSTNLVHRQSIDAWAGPTGNTPGPILASQLERTQICQYGRQPEFPTAMVSEPEWGTRRYLALQYTQNLGQPRVTRNPTQHARWMRKRAQQRVIQRTRSLTDAFTHGRVYVLIKIYPKI